MKTINIIDYNEFPGLRHSSVSDYSGEDFYHKILNKTFKDAFVNKEKLQVILDYVDAYASSFLDEAFGNLVYDFKLDNVKNLIKIVSKEEPHWINMIENQTYPQWEKRRIESNKPIVTEIHEPWYRLVNDELILKVWETPA